LRNEDFVLGIGLEWEIWTMTKQKYELNPQNYSNKTLKHNKS